MVYHSIIEVILLLLWRSCTVKKASRLTVILIIMLSLLFTGCSRSQVDDDVDVSEETELT